MGSFSGTLSLTLLTAPSLSSVEEIWRIFKRPLFAYSFDIRDGLLREVVGPVGEIEERKDGREDYPRHKYQHHLITTLTFSGFSSFGGFI